MSDMDQDFDAWGATFLHAIYMYKHSSVCHLLRIIILRDQDKRLHIYVRTDCERLISQGYWCECV